MPGPPVPLSLAPPATPNHGSAGYRPPAVWPDGILRGSEGLTDLRARSGGVRGAAGERGPGDRRISNREHRGVSVSRPAAVIVLAAGEGTRMKSGTPKVLHQICGESMLGLVLATA